jgi:hypothetical protein
VTWKPDFVPALMASALALAFSPVVSLAQDAETPPDGENRSEGSTEGADGSVKPAPQDLAELPSRGFEPTMHLTDSSFGFGIAYDRYLWTHRTAYSFMGVDLTAHLVIYAPTAEVLLVPGVRAAVGHTAGMRILGRLGAGLALVGPLEASTEPTEPTLVIPMSLSMGMMASDSGPVQGFGFMDVGMEVRLYPINNLSRQPEGRPTEWAFFGLMVRLGLGIRSSPRSRPAE